LVRRTVSTQQHPSWHQGAADNGSAASAQDSTSLTNSNQQSHLRSSSDHKQQGKLLVQARLSRGWTQQHLADLLGTTAQTVSRWERGIATPGPYHRNKLSTIFGLSIAELGVGGLSEARPNEHTAETEAGQEEAQAAQAADQSRRLIVPHQRHAVILWRIIASVLVLVALLLLAWPAALTLLAQGVRVPTPQPKSAASGTAAGTIAFLSSDAFAGNSAGNSAAGMNDEVAIRLSGVPRPPAGTSYFAWMTGSAGSEAVWTPLGRLAWTPSPRSGSGSLSTTPVGTASLFSVSPQHTNWLVTYYRFLVTEEATSIAPLQPSAWVYAASISTTPTPGDPNHYSLLDHLRHLLAADPQLAALGIKGGLIYWLARNSEQVAQLASGLQTDWQHHQWSRLRYHLICMLQYLDGSPFLKADLPPGTSLPTPSPSTRIGLLTLSPAQEPPGYALHTDIHLDGVRDALGATAAQRQEALRLRIAMNAVSQSLTNVREDALHLLHMDDAHLAQPSTLRLLTDLTTQAKDAAGGPSTGANWIEQQSQQLAIFTWDRV
jgi:transcriptional regulator with XRE-family HTH domain